MRLSAVVSEKTGPRRAALTLMTTLIIMALLYSGAVARANDLPTMPVAKAAADRSFAPLTPGDHVFYGSFEPFSQPKYVLIPHPFYDRRGRIELAIVSTVVAFDAGQTCHNLATGGRELSLPTQRCGPAVAMLAGQAIAGEVIAYVLHRSGHHRLERVPRAYLLGDSLFGIIGSKRKGAW